MNFDNAELVPAVSEACACNNKKLRCLSIHLRWMSRSIPMDSITCALRSDVPAYCCAPMAARLASLRGGWVLRSLSQASMVCTTAPTSEGDGEGGGEGRGEGGGSGTGEPDAAPGRGSSAASLSCWKKAAGVPSVPELSRIRLTWTPSRCLSINARAKRRPTSSSDRSGSS